MKTPALCLLVFCAFTASAQVKKCTVDGKVTYSDSLCPTASKESVVHVRPNTLDHSGLRASASRQQEDAALQQLTANPPAECRFKAFKYGDHKGQALAQNAKQECIQNVLAAGRGDPPSLVAYQLWKDHNGQVSTDRRATAGRINASENARRIAESNESAIQDLGRKLEDRTYTCKRSSLNTDLTCK